MQVTKVTSPMPETAPTTHKFTQEQLQTEFNYMQVEKITKKLLEKGFITEGEYARIMEENRRSFPTYLAPIL